jgi:hypothetical protein
MLYFLIQVYKLVNLCMIFCEILTLHALLDFEKYKIGVPRIGSIQRPRHIDNSFLQMDN